MTKGKRVSVYFKGPEIDKINDWIAHHPQMGFSAFARTAINQYIEFHSPRLYTMKQYALDNSTKARKTDKLWIKDE